ncbi:MAG: hypothetical protein R3C54_13395 [Parvularculaceae bacterium]
MSIALLFMLAAAAPQDAPTPPPWRDYTRPCTCEEVDPKADYVTFKGVVIDGEVRLDESGLKAFALSGGDSASSGFALMNFDASQSLVDRCARGVRAV